MQNTGVYVGPERRDERRIQRKNVLTDDDILLIAMKVDELHVCRYDIEPADMKKLMEFVRSFYDTSIETRRTFRTMAIRMIVWGSIVGFLGLLANRFGWFKAIARVLTIPVP